MTIIPELGISIFLLLSSYHIGDLNPNESSWKKIIKGSLIITSSYFTSDGSKVWGNSLYLLGVTDEKILHIFSLLININTISFVSCSIIYKKKSFIPLFLLHLMVLFTDIQNFLMIYSTIIHLPIFILRAKKRFGKKCYIIFPSIPLCYLFLKSITWNVGILRVIISFSVSHLLLHFGILKIFN